MPTDTFHRLPEEKKQKLIDAAYEEFSNVPYAEASINAIIANAGISRGSFYMYFEDKEDIFKYLLVHHNQKFRECTIEAFSEHDGELFSSFEALFDKIINYLNQKEHQKFLKQVFTNMNSRQEEFIIPHRDHCHRNKKLIEILKLVNPKNLTVETEEELLAVLDIIFPITVHTIIMASIGDITKEEAKKMYLQKLKLLKEGIERREVC